MYLLRWAAAWALYGAGYLVYLICDSGPAFVWEPLFDSYQAIMNWSWEVQGESPGPWGPIRRRAPKDFDS